MARAGVPEVGLSIVVTTHYLHYFISYDCVSTVLTKLKLNETWLNSLERILKHEIDDENRHGPSMQGIKVFIIF
jgi:hypothetical protein